jgi:hypothetical protein
MPAKPSARTYESSPLKQPVLGDRTQDRHPCLGRVIGFEVVDVEAHRLQGGAGPRHAHHSLRENAVAIDHESVNVRTGRLNGGTPAGAQSN